MTGEKNRYKPLDKMWKLDDEQLTTPKHDEMVLKLLNKNNIQKWFPIDNIVRIESEYPIKAPNGFLIGYWDIVILGINKNMETGLDRRVRYYVEVKPTITSFGATLRQINTYKSYLGSGSGYDTIVCLFTNDTTFKEAFESQRVKVIINED